MVFQKLQVGKVMIFTLSVIYPWSSPTLESHSVNSQGVTGQGLHSPFLISYPWLQKLQRKENMYSNRPKLTVTKKTEHENHAKQT